MHIIHEDNHYLIINKPAGLIVHGDGRTEEPTLVDWILKEFPDIADIGESWENDAGIMIPRPGIVHRLDRDTSGVMIIAKTQEMFDLLKDQFKNHTIKKEYLGYVYGSIKNDTGTIDAPIGKSRSNFRMWSASRGARGQMRESITDYRVLDRIQDTKGNIYSYVLFQPQTGRTHQIRVHAKYLNHPLVADTLYAGKNLKMGNLGFERQALHSKTLSFIDLDGKEVSHIAEIPIDFEQVSKGE
jgi:23S rRNA pseudouridine1911/1915/1917 synthase